VKKGENLSKNSEYPVFVNAPITEALLDIRVELPKDIDLNKISTFHNSIKDRFPEKKERIHFEASFKITQGEPPTSTPTLSEPDGYLFRSPNENKIVQARLDGFTFNKLKPYEEWKLFYPEARKLWDLYFMITKPIRIIRIALRYINRIEIPLPMENFKEYIKTIPEIAPDLPQGLERFFMQLVIPDDEIQATAIINQTMEPPTPTQKLPLIFDIDVWKLTNYTANNKEMWKEEEMWKDFENLRAFKNKIFYKSITKKAEELFK
jgi:uncharacterized protein (TIGR04255 family)